MSRPLYFNPLIRSCRNWLRKRNRILPSTLPPPFFYGKDIDTVDDYFAHCAEHLGEIPHSQHTLKGNCFVCKAEVDFSIDKPVDDGEVSWRETLRCPQCKLINRWRGCLHVFEAICEPRVDDRIYLTETLSPIYQNLSKRFPLLASSEYFQGHEFGDVVETHLMPVRNEDVTKLSFADASLDIVLCFDVLEHVPDYRTALREFYRVLVAGGQLLISVPFSYEQETLVRATRDEKGHINHLVEPCYHGDPLSEEGVLSYYDFGMDLLDDMRAAGFEECFLACYCSELLGYMNGNIVFIARKLKSHVKKSTMAKLAWQAAGNKVSLIKQDLAGLAGYITLFAESLARPVPRQRSQAFNVALQFPASPVKDAIGVVPLPDIFHYWSNEHIAADMSRFGFSNPEGFFFHYTKMSLEECGNRRVNILSIASGDGGFEIEIAKRLLKWHLTDFTFECLNFDRNRLRSAKIAVTKAGLEKYFRFTNTDPNLWRPFRKYKVVFANQSLHDARNLEGLLDAVKRSLLDDGLFIVSDTIGRNGNMCWPEAMRMLGPFWDELPPGYRYNRVLKRQEDQFINHDGSAEGLGAIRSQDILPLLLERFNFRFFFPYGNIIYVFISQSFGHNFNADADWDKDFIDRVHARDEAAMLSGELKPCSMHAVLTKQKMKPVLRHASLTPRHCLRKFDGDHASVPQREMR